MSLLVQRRADKGKPRLELLLSKVLYHVLHDLPLLHLEPVDLEAFKSPLITLVKHEVHCCLLKKSLLGADNSGCLEGFPSLALDSSLRVQFLN